MNLQPDDIYENNKYRLRLFLAFQILGGLGNVAMLTTALASKRVVRHSTWINFCGTWIIYFISYTLLFFTDQQTNPMGLSYPLCLTQAALIYSAPVLTTCSSLSLIIEIWLHLRHVVVNDWDEDSEPTRTPKRSSSRLVLLLFIPYVVWFSVLLGAVVHGLQHPNDVGMSTSYIYCVIRNDTIGTISVGVAAVALVSSICFQGAIMQTLYECRWRTANKDNTKPGKVSMSIIIRAFCFIVVNIVATSMLFVYISHNAWPVNVAISLMPLIVFVLFSTQTDIMRVWTFRS